MTHIPQRIWRDELIKAFKIYERELADFIYRPATPTMIEHMKMKIETVRRHYRAMDRNPVWDVPVSIIHSGPGTFDLHPELEGFILDDKPRIPF